LPGEPLLTVLERHAVTTVLLPPSALAALPAAPLPQLATLIVGGEACTPEVLAPWLGGRTVLNAYGPTEASVCTTMFGCMADGQMPALGRPLANTRTYVLDGALEPAPVGVAGELYIGGAGLARGYAGRSGLTAERFVPSPFGTGERLYRTGDLVRWRADGNLEFLGRRDTQVKLRGFRIELGEIEAALAAHAGVQQAAVVAREEAGDKRLVAYVVPAEAAAPDLGDLRAHLKRTLPDHMVPQAFVTLTSLPLMPNGKLDRKVLPAPDGRASADYVAPRNALETTLANLFAEVLGHARVGIHDNFFELGGDSIRAVALCSRISTAPGRKLPVAVLFAGPSVAGVADYAGTGATASRRIALRRSHGARHAVCFLPTALGSGLVYRRLAHQLATAADTFTCNLPGCAAGEIPLTSIEDIAAYCRRELIVPDTHEMARQMLANGLAVRRLVLIDSYLPPRRETWPSNEPHGWAENEGSIGPAAVASPGQSASAGDLLASTDPLQVESLAALGGAGAVSQLYRANVSALGHYAPTRCQVSSFEIRAEQTSSRLSPNGGAPRPLPVPLERIIVLPGDHYSIMGEESLSSLAVAVDEGLR
jgi:thioesterase domain-containing protein